MWSSFGLETPTCSMPLTALSAVLALVKYALGMTFRLGLLFCPGGGLLCGPCACIGHACVCKHMAPFPLHFSKKKARQSIS